MMDRRLTVEQKVKVVEWYLDCKSITVQRLFRSEFKCSHAPSRKSISQYVKQFRETGNVTGKPKGGSQQRRRIAAAVEDIRRRVMQSPMKKSLQRLSTGGDVSVKMVWRVLRKDLQFFHTKSMCINN